MLRLPPFEYLAPKNLDDAVRLLAQHGNDAMLVAGGTDLYANMKRRLSEPKFLIGLNGLRELRGIKIENGAIVIGAGTTLSQITNSQLLATQYPALTTAASLVSTPQLRNTGTIGGNLCLDTRCNYYDQTYFYRKALDFCMKKDGTICRVAPGGNRCWAISSTDCAPVVVALGARVRLVGPNGAREIPASALYCDDGIDYLTKARNEILTEIILPPADGLKSIYLKLRRRGSFDFPMLGVATAVRFSSNGIVKSARLVLGAIASQPIQMVNAEKVLLGQELTPDVIKVAAGLASESAKPMDNADGAYAWRKKMVSVYVERALEQIAR